MDVGTLVARAATRYGSRVALEGPDGTRTFAEVGANAMRLARALRGLGLKPGDRVLDLQKNACTYVETDFGISIAGLCRVALNYRLNPADWARIAEDSGARAIIYSDAFAGDVDAVLAQVEHAIVIGGSTDAAGLAWSRLLAEAPAGRLPPCAPDDLVSLNYSSGTTGRPKGARRTHRNRTASLTNIVIDVFRGVPGPDDAWCHAGPITHASGLFVLPSYALGARQVILPTWDPEALLEAIEERGCTGAALVPTMVARLLAHHGLTGERTSRLRRLAYAGAPMPPEQVRQAYERVTPNLVQFYGLVEAIPPVTVLDAADHAAGIASEPDLLASAGRPCHGVELRVVDEGGNDVATGAVGEVITRGDHVMGGYYLRDGVADNGTAARAVVEGWLQTGDLGRVDGEGRLFLVDRKGDMIISGGYNIYPREVEDVIAEVPGIREVAVVGVSDPDWGQRVVAVWSAVPGASVTDEMLAAHCRDRLASFKKPKALHRVESFPHSSTGKIAKRELRNRLESGTPLE